MYTHTHTHKVILNCRQIEKSKYAAAHKCKCKVKTVFKGQPQFPIAELKNNETDLQIMITNSIETDIVSTQQNNDTNQKKVS